MDKRSGIVEREQGPLDQRAEGERSGRAGLMDGASGGLKFRRSFIHFVCRYGFVSLLLHRHGLGAVIVVLSLFLLYILYIIHHQFNYYIIIIIIFFY